MKASPGTAAFPPRHCGCSSTRTTSTAWTTGGIASSKGGQESNILLGCLSPDYFKSDNCLWEWEENHRHKASRLIGHESVTPACFVEAPGSHEQAAAAL